VRVHEAGRVLHTEFDGEGDLGADEVLPYPAIALDADTARRVRQGQRPQLRFEGRALLLDPAGRLAAVAEAADGRLQLLRVWPESSED